mgnify:CR=1 FL=1
MFLDCVDELLCVSVDCYGYAVEARSWWDDEWKFREFDVGSFDVDSKEHGVCLMRVLMIYRLR